MIHYIYKHRTPRCICYHYYCIANFFSCTKYIASKFLYSYVCAYFSCK